MYFDEYEQAARSFAGYPDMGTTSVQSIVYLALGAAGEAGEIANSVKHLIRDRGMSFQDTAESIPPQDLEDIVLEIGDVLWYLSQLSCELGLSLDYCAGQNLYKLNRRHS